MENFQLGTRIVVRYRIAGPLPLTDALGVLLASDDDALTIETRRGTVVVAKADIVAAKEVPPAPPQRRR
nr:hypothetical protein [Psychromicrobium silvestre]